MRATVDRDDPRVVDHLVVDHHVAGRLDDLVRVVVSGREHAGRRATRDAAIPHAHELVRIAFVRAVVVARRFRFGTQRHAAVRRVDDERGAQSRHDAIARIEPELVVAADVSATRPSVFIAARRRLLPLDRLGLRFGQKRLVAQARRALERRERGIGPDALHVGLTVRGSRRRPRLPPHGRLRRETGAGHRDRHRADEPDVLTHRSSWIRRLR